MNLNQCYKKGERFTEVIEQKDSSLYFGLQVNASLRHRSLPVLLCLRLLSKSSVPEMRLSAKFLHLEI